MAFEDEPVRVVKNHWSPDLEAPEGIEFRDSSGHTLMMCILHEVRPYPEKREAIVVMNGMSLCREHMDILLKRIDYGVLDEARKGRI